MSIIWASACFGGALVFAFQAGYAVGRIINEGEAINEVLYPISFGTTAGVAVGASIGVGIEDQMHPQTHANRIRPEPYYVD